MEDSSLAFLPKVGTPPSALQHVPLSSALSALPPAPRASVGVDSQGGTQTVALGASVAAGLTVGWMTERRNRRRCGAKSATGSQPAAPTAAGAASSTASTASTAADVVDVEELPLRFELTKVVACPVCRGELSRECECPRCKTSFPRRKEGNFLDLTIGAACPLDDAPAATSKDSERGSGFLEDGLLQRLPGSEQLDSIAQIIGLPTSKDVDGLAKEVLRDITKVIPSSSSGSLSTTTFQSPLVSFAYERGWRQSFEANGFPGPEEEYQMAKDFLEKPLAQRPADAPAPVLLDCSCGSGILTRRFAGVNSGAFKAVVALDFSESMLRTTNQFAAEEAGAETYATYPRPLHLLRGDVSRLPLQSGSLAGVHASAAIHCWPAPDVALAEIARVLEPGAAVVLSTFTRRARGGRTGQASGFRFWTEEDLRMLTRQTGLVNFEAITRDPAFILIKATKPL
eukprot:TRINITY_DN38699_c0_g1_i1.p1 TRINITY_DN38699_c0_g1~~TRINITY_DN38699_c0_g1_i1.p1  ORF type:complete len:456 (+),score=51.88 TRINITY_DN38699_c0_g1_i1:123-1490(+)